MKFSTLFFAVVFGQGVLSCVHFTGTRSNSGFTSTLIDNGDEECWYGGPFQDTMGFNCIAGNFGTIVTNEEDGLHVHYATPWDPQFNFVVGITSQDASQVTWSAIVGNEC